MNVFKRTATGALIVVGIASSSLGARLDKYEEPRKGPLQIELEKRKTPDLRAEFKARVLSGAMQEGEEFSMEGIDVQVERLFQRGKMLVVKVTAQKDGEELIIGTPPNYTLSYVNADFVIRGKKFHKELMDGKEVDVANPEESPREA